ncbi:hypothetical protein [Micromonospora sp. CPCC 206061]|uniref:hypothetical protein n=1 Tax=Micromonospora sp. CPCC 206061 TaxID=3122410 RepID=UPI002FEFA50D
MGALVTLELADDSPVLDLPWIITFGPLDDDDDGWEPVVCGPYERPHALALAEAVVADEDLMAVVEPLLPHISVDEIRGEITAARLAVEEGEPEEEFDSDQGEPDEPRVMDEPHDPPGPEEIRAGLERIAARLATYAPS